MIIDYKKQNDLNTARSGFAMSGGQPAALAMGGSPDTAKTENWNGSSWTEVADIPVTKRNHGGSKITADTSALVFGGYRTPILCINFGTKSALPFMDQDYLQQVISKKMTK